MKNDPYRIRSANVKLESQNLTTSQKNWWRMENKSKRFMGLAYRQDWSPELGRVLISMPDHYMTDTEKLQNCVVEIALMLQLRKHIAFNFHTLFFRWEFRRIDGKNLDNVHRNTTFYKTLSTEYIMQNYMRNHFDFSFRPKSNCCTIDPDVIALRA